MIMQTMLGIHKDGKECRHTHAYPQPQLLKTVTGSLLLMACTSIFLRHNCALPACSWKEVGSRMQRKNEKAKSTYTYIDRAWEKWANAKTSVYWHLSTLKSMTDIFIHRCRKYQVTVILGSPCCRISTRRCSTCGRVGRSAGLARQHSWMRSVHDGGT